MEPDWIDAVTESAVYEFVGMSFIVLGFAVVAWWRGGWALPWFSRHTQEYARRLLRRGQL